MDITANELSKVIKAISSYQKEGGAKQGRLPILLHGVHGCGKTSVVKACAELGFNPVILNLSVIGEPGELIGLPEKRNGRTCWTQPEWLNQDALLDKPIIYFLDEMNRGEQMIVQTMLPFVLEGRLHTHYIRPQDVVVAAINPANEDYVVNDAMFNDKALMDRFVQFVFKPTAEEFYSYTAKRTTVHPAILKIFKEHPSLIELDEVKLEVHAPSRRRLTIGGEFVNHISKDDIWANCGAKICCAIFGNDLGRSIYADVTNSFKYKLTIEEILNGGFKTNKFFHAENVDEHDAVLANLAYTLIKGVKIDSLNRPIMDTMSDNFSQEQQQNIAHLLAHLPADYIHGWIKQRVGDAIMDTINDHIMKSGDKNADKKLIDKDYTATSKVSFISVIDKWIAVNYPDATIKTRVLDANIKRIRQSNK